MKNKYHILQGMSGKTSFLRVSIFIITITIMSVYLAHNIIAMIRGVQPISIGTTEIGLLTALFGAKAVQRFGEKDINKEAINDEDKNHQE